MSIWVYAYAKAVGSAREIAKRTEYDPAFQWLTGMEIINHHTLSDFRVDHKEYLDQLFCPEPSGITSAEGLVTLERVAARRDQGEGVRRRRQLQKRASG